MVPKMFEALRFDSIQAMAFHKLEKEESEEWNKVTGVPFGVIGYGVCMVPCYGNLTG